MPPTWEQYRSRYRERPGTFDAYVDVWIRVSGVRDAFGGWVGFSQAANGEPAQLRERVRAAERFMRQGGYEDGPRTDRGARTWIAVEDKRGETRPAESTSPKGSRRPAFSGLRAKASSIGRRR